MTSPQAIPAAERVVPSQMAHLVYQCRTRDETVESHLQLFQAHIVFKDDVLTFITYDNEHHRLAFFNMPHLTPRDCQTADVHHVAYSFSSIGDFLTTYLRLKAAGILPYWCIVTVPPRRCTFAIPKATLSSSGR